MLEIGFRYREQNKDEHGTAWCDGFNRGSSSVRSLLSCSEVDLSHRTRFQCADGGVKAAKYGIRSEL